LGQVEKVRADLTAMADILAVATERGVRFHIATGLPDLHANEEL
jgi:hypothetical protein